ncbi:MAG TPA: hypothetical protein VNO75_03225 [Gemmatimonadaceae bacterium]|nr:hypothetical protein [Gemmatimonadaceae bacterium]
MNFGRLKIACLAIATLALAACSDSTGSGTVTSEDAFRSLSRGLNTTGLLGIPASSLGDGTELGQVDVTIDGAPQRMYALGLRVTYPAGTCFESIFMFPPSPGFPAPSCSPPPLGLVLVMWQTRSGSRPPDRTIVISADVGTADFDFLNFDGEGVFAPTLGIYAKGDEEIWAAISGTLTSQVTATSQTCQATPPPFAKSATCHVATFDESGRIVFQELDLDFFAGGTSTPRTVEVVIPRQNIVGILQAVTEIRPITLPNQGD